MSIEKPKSVVADVPTVVVSHAYAEPHDWAPYRLELHSGGDVLEAVSWIGRPSDNDRRRVYLSSVTFMELTQPYDEWIVLELRRNNHTPLIPLIPESLGADSSIVQRLRYVVASIASPPIVTFINDVFHLRKVYSSFWTSPASRNHHHAYRGGLAEHSIEIAEQIIGTPNLDTVDRDIGIAHALLHDIGKLWCYDERGYSSQQVVGHEFAGVVAIHDELESLGVAWPDAAIALRSLLSGLWKSKGKLPALAVGKIVQAYDQKSAEQDLRSHKAHPHRPWTAAPCPKDRYIPLPW